MANTETPSQEYPWIVVSEDHPAFKDKKAAIRHVKREWAAQSPAQRDRHVLATIYEFIDPDYDIDVIETPVHKGKEVKGEEAEGKRGRGRAEAKG